MAKLVPVGFKVGPIAPGNFTDDAGNPTVIDAVLRTESSNPTAVEIRDIGGQLFAVGLAVGSAQISVVCDVRLGAEVREVTFIADETVDVPAGEAAFASVTLGDVTPV